MLDQSTEISTKKIKFEFQEITTSRLRMRQCDCKQEKKCTETKNRFVLFLRDAIFIGVAAIEN